MTDEGRPYNVNLDKNEAVFYVLVDHELPIEEFIIAVRAATEGLTDPSITIEHEEGGYDSFSYYEFFVGGRRQLTDEERQKIIDERDRSRRYQEHMAQFKG